MKIRINRAENRVRKRAEERNRLSKTPQDQDDIIAQLSSTANFHFFRLLPSILGKYDI